MSSPAQKYYIDVSSEYPVPKTDFTKYFVYAKGECVFRGDSKDLIDFSKSKGYTYNAAKDGSIYKFVKKYLNLVVEEDFDQNAYKAAVQVRSNRLNAYRQAFKADLFAEAGIVSSEKADRFYDKVVKVTGDDAAEIEILFREFAEFLL